MGLFDKLKKNTGNAFKQYLKLIESNGVDFGKTMQTTTNKNKINELEKLTGCILPDSFKELYEKYNGEKESLGFIAGFEFLSIEKVIDEYSFFKTCESEFSAVGTESIVEAPLSKCNLIPFAHDGSRCFIALDMSPSDKGTIGQIIGIDFDYDRTYLFADNLEGFFKRLSLWIEQGNLVIKKNEKGCVISEKTGHLFNNVKIYAIMPHSEEHAYIEITDDFWRERYSEHIIKNEKGIDCLLTTVFESETGEFRIVRQNRITEISCKPFLYLENVIEVVLHDAVLRDFDCLCQMKNLKKLFLVNCKIQDSDISKLSSLPKLKELHLMNTGTSASIGKLSEMKSLKILSLGRLENFDESVLGNFTNITDLDISDLDYKDCSFLSKLTKLENLILQKKEIDNLDFLNSLGKLKFFQLLIPAKNESGLAALKNMDKLQEFRYPVKDLTVYQGLKNIKCIGLSEENNGRYDVFEGSSVNSFFLISSSMDNIKTKSKEVHDKLSNYVKAPGYGGTVV